MKNDDKVKARQRFRICPTTMRMMTCTKSLENYVVAVYSAKGEKIQRNTGNASVAAAESVLFRNPI